MPRVSVVIPVYNAADYLPRTLGDLSAQTLTDIEVICVDDGSSDAGREIIAEHARRDPRFRLIEQQNSGSTVARNRGLELAAGEFLVFVDADDAFEPLMLEAAAARLEQTGADICLYNGCPLDESTGPFEGRYLRRRLIPDREVFAPSEVPDDVFQLVTPAVWLRMYRRRFLIDGGFRFTPGQIPDDICFTADTLAGAASLTVLDEALVRYREGHAGSATSRWDQRPLAFESALDDLGDRLRARGQFDEFEHSYRVLCLDAITHVIRRLVTADAQQFLRSEIETRLLAKYGLDTLEASTVSLKPLRPVLLELQGRDPEPEPAAATKARTAAPKSAVRRVLGGVKRRLSRGR